MKYGLVLLIIISSSSHAALSLSDIMKSGKQLGDVRTTKTFYMEPYLGVNWNKWNQQIDSTAISGELGGNSLDYNYGLNLYYILAKKFAIGYGHRLGQVNWIYSYSEGFETDNDWTEKTRGESLEQSLILGLSFNSFNLIYMYHFNATLGFNDFYMEDYEKVNFYGTGHMIKLLFNNSFSFLSFYAGVNTYTTADFDGEEIDLPDTVGSTEFEILNTQYAGMELTFPIGLF